RYASDLAYMGGGVYGAPAATPYGSNPYGTAGSSDDCYVSDASEDYTDGPADGVVAAPAPAAAAGVPRRGDAVVDGFTDADLMYAQLASSLYGADTPYGYCGSSGPAAGLSGYDCSRFQLTNYGHLKIDYSCSWRSLDAYIAHS
ncbi:Protein arginine N-methyltransferase 6, partial [Frankliniella fusca]